MNNLPVFSTFIYVYNSILGDHETALQKQPYTINHTDNLRSSFKKFPIFAGRIYRNYYCE